MATIGPYSILRIIGKGGFSVVLLARHQESGELCALKIMDRNPEHEDAMLSIVSNEVDVMSSISHPNIINLLSYSYTDSLVKPNGETKDIFYLALELATNGELFDFVAETGAFSEEFARYYFHQLMNAFEYLNLNGISHRDIKPENIMLDKDYNLKLADFGFSSCQPLNQSRKGTLNYMAPEIIEELLYNGHCADLFSAGIILFLMVSKHAPFIKACATDSHYKMIMGNREDLFWKLHSKNKPENFYSESFMQLVTSLFAYSPMERPSLAEIKAHEWYNGPVPTAEEVKDEFDRRKLALIQENYQPDSQSPGGSPDPSIYGNGAFRSLENEEKIERKLEAYVPEYKRYTQFFSSADPEQLFSTLALYAEKKCKEIKFDKTTYSATMKTNGENEIEITVNILKVEDKKYCFEVIKESGDRFEFDSYYRNIRDFYGGLVNLKA